MVLFYVKLDKNYKDHERDLICQNLFNDRLRPKRKRYDKFNDNTISGYGDTRTIVKLGKSVF